jgi:UDP-N-acetylmuramate--alanine ligase
MLKSRGAIVSGSDNSPSEATEALASENIAITFDQSKSWLPDACDLVIASAAVRPDHLQMLEAERRGVPAMLYAEALGKCMQGRTSICIAGTHGKSTTTAMTGCALTDAGLEPTVIVGATSPQLVKGTLHSGNEQTVGFRLGHAKIPTGGMEGKPGLLVAEACEYNRSFHNYRPTIGYISSIEADHLDCYGTLEAVIESFHEFAKLLPDASNGGKLLIAHDGAHRREVTAGVKAKVQTIGFSPAADWQVKFDPSSREAALLDPARREVCRWTVKMPERLPGRARSRDSVAHRGRSTSSSPPAARGARRTDPSRAPRRSRALACRRGSRAARARATRVDPDERLVGLADAGPRARPGPSGTAGARRHEQGSAWAFQRVRVIKRERVGVEFRKLPRARG